jgi:hypothetical protein
MKIGDKVIYNRDLYQILYIYTTGYCEIRKEKANYTFELVHMKDLERTQDTFYFYIDHIF